MTIIEAVRSGKTFWRKNFTKCSKTYSGLQLDNLYLSPEDILSNEWEIEEEKIEITKDQLLAAYKKASIAVPALGAGYSNYTCRIDILAKELGFKE